jgi:hypothetical protein
MFRAAELSPLVEGIELPFWRPFEGIELVEAWVKSCDRELPAIVLLPGGITLFLWGLQASYIYVDDAFASTTIILTYMPNIHKSFMDAHTISFVS